MGTNLYDSNIDRMGIIQIALNPGTVPGNTSVEQIFTVPGLTVGDMLVLTKPTVTAGLTLTNPRVAAADTLAVTFSSVSALDPPSEVYQLLWFRSDEAGPFPGGLPGGVAI